MYRHHAPLKINVISDIHCYSKSLGITGPDFEKDNQKSANDLIHNEEILSALSKQLSSADEPEIILVSGDLTHNGEYESHKAAVSFLQSLQSAGKRVYVITATHDYSSNGESKRYTKDGSVPEPAAKRSELFDMYYGFGPKEAIAVHKESMSYIVQLCEGYRLFALNDDSNSDGGSGFSDECFRWIAAQVAAAKKDGQFIVAMTHHPMISPSPFYSIIGENDLMRDGEKRCFTLADMGVPMMLTGHSHMQDISFTRSARGNIFYDVTTACPVGYPGTFRTVEYNPAKKEIAVFSHSVEIGNEFELNGETLEKHLENKFFGMIRTVIDSAAYDTPKLARLVTSFSVKPKLVYKYGWLIRPLAKALTKLKIKHAAAICKKETGLKKADYSEIADEKVIDFIMSLVMNLYRGDGPYTPDTAYYKIAMGACGVFDSVLDALGIEMSRLIKGTDGLSSLVEPLLYNHGIPDRNAVLKLSALFSGDNPAPKTEPEKKPEPPSKRAERERASSRSRRFASCCFCRSFCCG